jgi:hypothetical protein
MSILRTALVQPINGLHAYRCMQQVTEISRALHAPHDRIADCMHRLIYCVPFVAFENDYVAYCMQHINMLPAAYSMHMIILRIALQQMHILHCMHQTTVLCTVCTRWIYACNPATRLYWCMGHRHSIETVACPYSTSVKGNLAPHQMNIICMQRMPQHTVLRKPININQHAYVPPVVTTCRCISTWICILGHGGNQLISGNQASKR